MQNEISLMKQKNHWFDQVDVVTPSLSPLSIWYSEFRFSSSSIEVAGAGTDFFCLIKRKTKHPNSN